MSLPQDSEHILFTVHRIPWLTLASGKVTLQSLGNLEPLEDEIPARGGQGQLSKATFGRHPPPASLAVLPWRCLLGGRKPISREQSGVFCSCCRKSSIPCHPHILSLEMFREEKGSQAVNGRSPSWGLKRRASCSSNFP